MAPMFLPALIYRGATFFTPLLVAMVIERTAPITTTKRIARSFRPNQRRDKGNQQMLGRVCIPRTREPTVSSSHRHLPVSIPKGIPIARESK